MMRASINSNKAASMTTKGITLIKTATMLRVVTTMNRGSMLNLSRESKLTIMRKQESMMKTFKLR